MKYKIFRHARTEMERRNISQSLVESVLNAPGQVVSEKEDRKVYQSKIDFGRFVGWFEARNPTNTLSFPSHRNAVRLRSTQQIKKIAKVLLNVNYYFF